MQFRRSPSSVGRGPGGWLFGIWNWGSQISGVKQAVDDGGSDPLAAIRAVSALASEDSSALLVLTNVHRFLQSAEVVQALVQQLVNDRQNRTFVFVLSPIVQIPVELEKLFIVVEHPLPGREQLEEIARGVATADGEKWRSCGK